MEYPIDPKAELFTWGPIPYRIFYGDIFYGLVREFSKSFPGYGWSRSLVLIKEGRLAWIEDNAEVLKDCGRGFTDRMLPLQKRNDAHDNANQAYAKLRELYVQVDSPEISQHSNEAFLYLWRDFHARINTYWSYATLPEFASFGALPILEQNLEPYVETAERVSVVQALTAPEEPSFFQQEEIELTEADNLEAHQQKYFWLENSYSHVGVLPVSFFEARKKTLLPGVKEEVGARLRAVSEHKKEIERRYKLSPDVMHIAGAICAGVTWQDERKKHILTYLHYKRLLLEEAARRLGQDAEKMVWLSYWEIEELLAGKEIGVDITSRQRAFGYLLEGDSVQLFDEEATLNYWTAYVDVRPDRQVTEFSGLVACRGAGPVQGTARIVLDSRKGEHFKKGDILVTSMTSPEYIYLMRQAAAIITDSGGLTSHAAIVSRELNVPCIIGTKNATRVLKDGDRVEVDAQIGIVRILEKHA